VRLLVLFLLLASNAQAEERGTEADVAVLLAWLKRYAPELPVPREPLAAVFFVPHAEIEHLTGIVSHDDSRVLGACYRHVIYLDARLDIVHDMMARSVLLHELVHFAQNGCKIPRTEDERVNIEDQAYRIQEYWITQYAYDRSGKLKPTRWRP
jgi:hypothetical protein